MACKLSPATQYLTSPGLQTSPADTTPAAGDGGVQMGVLPEHEAPWAVIRGFSADLQCW